MEKTKKMKKRLMYALYLAIVVPFAPVLLVLFFIQDIAERAFYYVMKLKVKMLK